MKASVTPVTLRFHSAWPLIRCKDTRPKNHQFLSLLFRSPTIRRLEQNAQQICNGTQTACTSSCNLANSLIGHVLTAYDVRQLLDKALASNAHLHGTSTILNSILISGPGSSSLTIRLQGRPLDKRKRPMSSASFVKAINLAVWDTNIRIGQHATSEISLSDV